jgi:DsbC/DsbD-like thiol-disulfide interchange protein
MRTAMPWANSYRMISVERFLKTVTQVAYAAGIALALLSPAQAATSDWATNEGGRMRLVALAPGGDGHLRAALQIQPAPGWVTYWREPGESGIPPQISPAAGSKATVERVSYPVPKLISAGTVREIGYDAPVSLPLDVKTNGADQLALTVFIGICKQVCIPFQAELSVALPATATAATADATIVAAADAALPEPPSAGFFVQSYSLSGDGKSLQLDLSLPDSGGAVPQVYVTGPSGYVFFTQTGASRNGRDLRTSLAISGLPKSYVIHGKSWGILIVDGGRAMETTLAFE